MRRAAGFTLLEVLIALVIFGLAAAALLHAVGSGLAATRTSARYQEAISRARSHLDAATRGTTLGSTDNQGDDGGGFHWRVRSVRESSAVVSQPGPAKRPGRPVALYAVTVWVSWQDGDTRRAVRLDTEQVAGGGA